MKPVFSVIFFTVSSGAGFGLIALLVLAEQLHWGGVPSRGQLLAAGILALALITVGLLSSTLHLANPKNAWRAFSRFATSWLSREGVFSLLFYPFALAYLAMVYLDVTGLPRLVAGAGTVALAWITLYCTGMIYASLKPIPQWHTPLVPAGYVVLGHYSGALLLLAVLAYDGPGDPVYLHWALTWLALGAALKTMYYAWIRNPGVTPTINTATGITRANVRLLDAGHSHPTFLTNEFGFILARQHAVLGKTLVFLVGFVVPLLALSLGPGGMPSTLLAAASALVGLLIERWFFFAEARHVVRLYHGL